MNFVNLIVGVLMLFAGRRLFWVFVGGAGFVAGFELGQYLSVGQIAGSPFSSSLITGLAGGAIGVILALVVQRLAAITAGALAGGTAGMHLAVFLHWADAQSAGTGTAFVVGAVIGGLFFFFLFDWSLILFSSLAGAVLISEGLPVPPDLQWAVFTAAALFGILFQAGGALMPDKRLPDRRKSQ